MDLPAQWITGFVDGEGCFYVGFTRSKDLKTGIQVLPEFVVSQHTRSEYVLEGLKKYFGTGVVRSNGTDKRQYRVRSIKDLLEKVIPFFEKHQLKTTKRHDFQKFRSILLMMKDGKHLTSEGINEMKEIAGRMNTKRLPETDCSEGDDWVV